MTRKYIQGLYIGSVNENYLPHTKNDEKGLFLYNIGFYY